MILEGEKIIIKSSDLVSAKEILNYRIRNKDFMKDYRAYRDDDFYSLEFWEKTLDEDLHDEKEDKNFHFYIYPKNNLDFMIYFIGLSNITRGAFQSCFIEYQLDK